MANKNNGSAKAGKDNSVTVDKGIAKENKDYPPKEFKKKNYEFRKQNHLFFSRFYSPVLL